MGKILAEISDWNWEEVWKYAPDGVLRENVIRVIAIEDGCNDEEDWIGCFELDDGQFLGIRAGCDYTGWG